MAPIQRGQVPSAPTGPSPWAHRGLVTAPSDGLATNFHGGSPPASPYGFISTTQNRSVENAPTGPGQNAQKRSMPAAQRPMGLASKKRQRRPRLTGLTHPILNWAWEITAALASVILLLALVGLLAAYDNCPVSQLRGVTLNTYVAIFSTAGRTTLVFFIAEAIGQWKWLLYATGARPLLDVERVDAASRGPWGATLLVWLGRKTSILPLGALTIILSLALDPFAQQLVQTEIRMTNSASLKAMIARAPRYSQEFDLGPSGPVPAFADADIPMKTAILEGLTRTEGDVLNQTTYECPGDNCTWTPFESLAVCNSCNDLRGRVTGYKNFTTMINILDRDNTLGISTSGYTLTTENGLIMNNAENTTYVSPG
ncbi:MAG: hypothetical protein M1814_004043 [Vezdaea aestivalis]|nr:MAG: hypothetical protein M1814_004043 [Vezdaea aestivalis]